MPGQSLDIIAAQMLIRVSAEQLVSSLHMVKLALNRVHKATADSGVAVATIKTRIINFFFIISPRSVDRRLLVVLG